MLVLHVSRDSDAAKPPLTPPTELVLVHTKAFVWRLFSSSAVTDELLLFTSDELEFLQLLAVSSMQKIYLVLYINLSQ